MEVGGYPGHMARSKRLLREKLKLVDVVLELRDARIPVSSSNPDIRKITGSKSMLIVLNKADLADSYLTAQWLKKLSYNSNMTIAVDTLHGTGIEDVFQSIEKFAAGKIQQLMMAGKRRRAIRCMVVGIPNVGKSNFINRLVGRRVTHVGNRPGVTVGEQWIRIKEGFELLDTPGILNPKLEDLEVAFKLAVTGALKEDAFDLEEVAMKLLEWLRGNYPEALKSRYDLADELPAPKEILELIGNKQGFLLPGGHPDCLKSAARVLKDFRKGKLGRYTLEIPRLC